MTKEIINRVANSKLVTIDLEDYYPDGKRVILNLKDWLYEGLILREKEFRQKIKEHNWSQYKDCYVAITCSSDAIVPAWANMLLTINLEGVSKKTIVGNLEDLETFIFQEILNDLDVSSFKDKLLIVKGCTNKPIPPNAYIMLTNKLKPIAKSLMYGEACSSVPLYKRK